jgi:hypothetical protein
MGMNFRILSSGASGRKLLVPSRIYEWESVADFTDKYMSQMVGMTVIIQDEKFMKF